jgi:DNA-binding response OmpR family regulator
MGALVFLVDSEPEFRQLARECLEAAGYRVHTFSNVEAVSAAMIESPALILLGNGFSIRDVLSSGPFLGTDATRKYPTMVLLDHAQEGHGLRVLESGADDCIVKRLGGRELTARVQAILRRSVSAAGGSDSADVVIDTGAMKVFFKGREVVTTALEFRLIDYLARHRGQVFTRDVLLDAVWGETQFITPRSVDACVRRIREKIEPDRSKPTVLKTVRRVGYRWDAMTAWRSAVSMDCDCEACRN